VTRPSSDHDFSDAARPSDADPSPLRRLVLAQEEEPGGAAVRLFTSATLDDPDGLLGGAAPFTAEAYLRQSELGEQALAEGTSGPAVIACNYHEVPPENWPAVEERLRRLSDLGDSLDLDRDVEQAPQEPRTVVGFYDSYREAGLRGAELCAELGLRALFFPVFVENADEPGSAALTDDELADIARVHELGFHTASHVRSDEVGPDRLRAEVHDVLDRLTGLAGRPPRIAAWRGGTRFDPTRAGDRALRERGVGWSMSNWSVERVPPPRANKP
jgi:peptidoglycan/xylan/chitin deacetylase (PgdA/CDA1 family)